MVALVGGLLALVEYAVWEPAGTFSKSFLLPHDYLRRKLFR